MELISAAYADGIKQMMSVAKTDTVVTDKNVYQQANKDILPFIHKMLDGLVLPGSTVRGMEHLEALMDKAKSGSSCLLLVEHYSNFDLPALSYLLRKASPRGDEIADAIVAIAGMKLNEEHPVVAAFTSAYSRIVICPSRSIEKLDPASERDEIVRMNAINRAAMKSLNEVKKSGKLILVFPAGTRFRPWEPETKKGVREIDSYIKSFDFMCLVSINGDVLRIQQGKMVEDKVVQDLIHVESSPVVSCAEFREAARTAVGEDADRKQAVVDAIMARLEEMHARNEKLRAE